MSSYSEQEEFLMRLVHDLRQPLGTIETSAYLLNLVLEPAHTQAREQIRAIERQVDHAGHLLCQAAGELRRLRTQRAGADESLDLTKPETAAVT